MAAHSVTVTGTNAATLCPRWKVVNLEHAMESIITLLDTQDWLEFASASRNFNFLANKHKDMSTVFIGMPDSARKYTRRVLGEMGMTYEDRFVLKRNVKLYERRMLGYQKDNLAKLKKKGQDRNKFSRVKNVVIADLRQDAADEAFEVLALTASSLTTLTIRNNLHLHKKECISSLFRALCPDRSDDDCCDDDDCVNDDCVNDDCDDPSHQTPILTFPSLTHVHFGPNAMEDVNFLLHLIVNAPNLTTLELNGRCRSGGERTQCSNHTALISPSPAFETDLRSLLVHVNDPRRQRDSWEVEVGAMFDIFTRSPHLEKFGLHLDHYIYSSDEPRLFYALKKLSKLTELHLVTDAGIASPSSRVPSVRVGSTSVQHLAVNEWNWQFLFDENIHTYPSLEVLHLHVSDLDYSSDALLTVPPIALPMSIPFAGNIRRCSKLKTIESLSHSERGREFDFFEEYERLRANSAVYGRISSMNGAVGGIKGGELLIAHLLNTMVNEEEIGRGDVPLGATRWSFPYLDRQGARWSHKMVDMGVLSWKVHTDFRGVTVPLNIIEQMKTVHGVEDWNRRDVVASTEAWKVLLDWYQGA